MSLVVNGGNPAHDLVVIVKSEKICRFGGPEKRVFYRRQQLFLHQVQLRDVVPIVPV